MKQSKLESAAEASANVASGFIVSYLFWVLVVVHVWNIDTTPSQNFWITVCFTVLSLVRSYVWRRFFNRGLHRAIHALCRRAYGCVQK